ncbi:nonstructural protein [Peromfec virus RodF7_15]|uniref:Nonstructural protein n=1 Tax=Peromfec virus RodF7_15 TaxID=2929350 RepID=A0A976N2B1_9VIRU|nr:nonstructural protein [Peromfec virus RodF7_15]
MIVNVYSVYDKKAKLYQGMMTFINNEVALRYFLDIFKNPDSYIGKHPDDYIVYQIGTFNDATSEYEALPFNEDLINGNTIGDYANDK